MTESQINPPRILVAGGGTAGHIEPAMAVADAIRKQNPQATVLALGTPRGLESKVIPERGYSLALIDPVPVPRKINKDLFTLPARLARSIRQTKKILKENQINAVVGFGGYVSAPAYIAARLSRIPIFVHEANARAGMSNKLGMKLGGTGFSAQENSGINARVVGIPIKDTIASLERSEMKSQARDAFGLKQNAPVVLVTGGSQGAQALNKAVEGARRFFADAGIQVLHVHGPKNTLKTEVIPEAPAYIGIPYVENMDLAYSAADFIICRSGAMTVAEVSAVGLPALYVPLPHGNGEQALNAQAVVQAGGALLVEDSELDAQFIAEHIIPLVLDAEKISAMGILAESYAGENASDVIAEEVLGGATQHSGM